MSSRKVRSIPLFSPQSLVLPFNSAAFSGRVLFVVTLSLLLAGCDSQRKLEEAQEFIAAVKLAQVPSVLPPPTLAPARRYVYSSAGARSPFERPPTKTNDRENSQLVAPDFARQREALEEFPISELTMVGYLSLQGTILGLVETSGQEVLRIGVGNYLGRNHGRITAVRKEQIDLVEIVPSGDGGWVERPQILELRRAQE